MNSFMYLNPTKVFFGKGMISQLPNALKLINAEKLVVLLVYGGGSIKRSGLYYDIVKFVVEAGATLVELGGVEANPKLESVVSGIKLCKENGVNVIIGAGGGSAIDCAKAISVAANYDGDPWDVIVDISKISDNIPIIAIPTLTATGTETDSYAVITNVATGEKVGINTFFARPIAAIMDPTYTFTVNAFQTGAGTADILSHVLEVYFDSNDGAFIKNRICEAVMKTVVKYGPVAIAEPENYEARSNLMWAASIAINGELALGNRGTAWSCHGMEHPISGVYDITHGAGLAVLIPHWMRYILCDANAAKFAEYAEAVWGITDENKKDAAEKAIEKTREFFDSIGMPSTLRELGITDDSNFEKMAKDGVRNSKLHNAFVPLSVEDVINIYRMAF